MAVEGYKPPDTGNKQAENRYSVEHIREGFERTRKEKGDRYFAYQLGSEYQQAEFHNKREPVGAFSAQLQAISAVLPEIRSNPELNEIFSTSYQLGIEFQRLTSETMNVSSILNPTGEVRRKNAQIDKLTKTIANYREQILAVSKPASSSEQLTPIPKLCVPATLYQVRDETVPETHIHSCSICSAKK